MRSQFLLRVSNPLAHSYLKRISLVGIILILCACESGGPSVDAIRADGELRVALASIPPTYSLESGEILGFDYDLLREFCTNLGVLLKVTMVDTRVQAKALVVERKVHLAAGLIPISDTPNPNIRFGPSYSVLEAQLIYRSGTQRPRSVHDLVGAKVEALAGGLGDVELARLTLIHKDLAWKTPSEVSSEQLLARVNAGTIDYAVIPSTDFMALRLKYPRLDIGFTLGEPHATAWILPGTSRLSVDRALIDFFSRSKNNGLRKSLWYRYYALYEHFDFVDARAFLRGYDERFLPLRQYFVDAGTATGMDWRLLAALSYQESHWDPDARSPTGVRGLMMLTRSTADQLQVSRMDPQQAVAGGARYLVELRDRLPTSILGDDRLWFALAAYNIGLGHVEDARVLTQARGGNANLWRDVRRYIPLLSKDSIAATTRHGKARGGEPVHFVANIRRYFDAMRQLESRSVSAENLKKTADVGVSNVL